MASNVINSGLNLMNTAYNGAGGIVLSGDAVKGGYFVTDTIANIPSWSNVEGTLCYCTGDSKFYQYDGNAWKEAAFSGSNGSGISTVNSKEYSGGIFTPINYPSDTTVKGGGYLATSVFADDGSTSYNSSEFVKPRGISVNGAEASADSTNYYRPVIAKADGSIAELPDLTIYAPVAAGKEGEFVVADENGKVADIQTEDGVHKEYTLDVTHTTVHNSKGVELPSTGGTGTFWLITIGTLVAIGFAVFLITHKKMSIYKD